MRWAAIALVGLWCAWTCESGGATTARPVRGAIATVHPLATAAGLDAFASGGNAVDACVAAALTLGVVDGHNSGIGGGCFILIAMSDGRKVCIDGREMAPIAATKDMYQRAGGIDPTLSKTGPLAIAVPGALAAYAHALEQFGRLPLRDALQAGIKHADGGFAIDRNFARRLKTSAADLARFPATRQIFLKPDGLPYAEGDSLIQKDLASTYRAIAEHGPTWFYRDAFPKTCEDHLAKTGGILKSRDFEGYRVKIRTPLISRYRRWMVLGAPPPSSGGVHIAQMLNILEQFALDRLPQDSPAMAHLLIEAMKLAFADRAHWLGDPEFTNVPQALIEKRYGAILSLRIDPGKVTPVPSHGDPPDWQSRHFEKHTTHISVADDLGNWVACTATINTPFGSKCVMPGTGVLMNNQMDDFSISADVPNSFNLVGGEANAIVPRKRPLSSMSPTLVVEDGRVIMAIGASGGPTIISQTLLGLVRCLDHGMPAAEALGQPRFHHQWSPDRVRIENTYPDDFREQLERMGHHLEVVGPFGACQIVAVDATNGLHAAVDPRVSGEAGSRR